MKLSKTSLLLAAVLITLSSCSEGSGSNPPDPPSPPVPTPDPTPAEKVVIKINPAIDNTRATDTGFEQNDCIGMFVVNYNGSTPGSLQNSGNHVDNLRFTYSGVWTPDQPSYWKDETTPADFYIYYPYQAISSVTSIPFEVKADQSTITSYKASELIAGKATNIAPTATAVNITGRHLMSLMEIEVAAGNGFTAEKLAEADVKVRINGLKTHSTLNLTDLSITPTGEAETITPLAENKIFKALVVPQKIEETNLITVTIDGRDFTFKKGFTFEGGKRHRFTVTVNKTSEGINVNIGAWENDGQENGGNAE